MIPVTTHKITYQEYAISQIYAICIVFLATELHLMNCLHVLIEFHK